MNNKNKFILTSIVTLGVITSGCYMRSNDGMTDTSLGGISESFFGSPRNTTDSSDPNSYNQASGSTSTTNTASGSGYSNNAPSTPQSNGSMDRVDNLNLNNALSNQADDKATTWVNPSSNKRYTVTPKSSVNTGSDYCRTYTMNTIIDGQSQTITGRACKVNGKWVKQ